VLVLEFMLETVIVSVRVVVVLVVVVKELDGAAAAGAAAGAEDSTIDGEAGESVTEESIGV
jgi:hypothetical protein